MKKGGTSRKWAWSDALWALLWVSGLVLALLCAGRGSRFIYIDF